MNSNLTSNKCISFTKEEARAIEQQRKIFPMKMTDYYSSLLAGLPGDHVLRKVMIPSEDELIVYADDAEKDVHEDESKFQPVPGIIHRYHGKLLLVPTLECFSHCRFCFRAGHKVPPLPGEKLERALDYIRNTKEIREVIITGGDPLTLPMERLRYIMQSIKDTGHVEIMRITTRAVPFDPHSVTQELVDMIAGFKPVVWAHTFVHADEITPLCEEKLDMIGDAGIVQIQQGPILKGVNDSPEVLKKLYETLARNRVLAYYAIYGVYAPGRRHFIVERDEVRRILGALENQTSGYCVPHMTTSDQNNNKTRSIY